jgi:hypothetical protein
MTEIKDAGLSRALVETVAGLSAGSMATLIVHPLDIVKTRMQSTSGSSQELWLINTLLIQFPYNSPP